MLPELFAALAFAADRHREQLRKGVAGYPYVNHVIAVTELLARSGIDDIVTLQAALLHDTVEDTATTPEELAERFGPAVRDIVLEVTDDERLPKAERKRLQIVHAPSLSAAAKRIKLADKTCNVIDIAFDPPPHWSRTRRAEYVDWAGQVVRHCLGVGPDALEQAWRDAYQRARAVLTPDSGAES